MRTLIVLLTLLQSLFIYSQEVKEVRIKSEVDEVTVFVENAQVIRKKTVQVPEGISMLVFNNLSPFIIPKSVRTKVSGNVTVLAVNHQQEYIERLEQPAEIRELESEIEANKDKIDLLTAETEVINEEIIFLNSNRDIGGNEAIDMVALKEAANFYRNRLSELKTRSLQILKDKSILEKQVTKQQHQLNTLSSVKEYANGEVGIKVSTKKALNTTIELSYIVKNAGWLPFYDVKAKSVDDPLNLLYKANVRQDTKVDWKNVKIRLSTANPNISGVQPELKTYYLNYSTPPPTYNNKIDQVSGVVVDENNQPIPGVNVIVVGTSIGTTTDFEGRYYLTLPSEQGSLKFTYLGYETQIKPIQTSILNISMKESLEALEEVVVIGYGGKEKSLTNKLEGKAPGVVAQGENSIPLVQIERQTSVDFEIDLPYTILSDNKSYSVDMADYSLQADFKYVSIPKIEPTAFLIAHIIDWEQYNLIEGEANLFFEDAFVGKTILDVRSASDTLHLSLGRDENIIIKRNKASDFSTRQFIGLKKEEVRAWNIEIKNNKQQEINLEIYDQIPISTLNEITVEVLDKSKGKVNQENGEVFWDLFLKPNEVKNLSLKFSVKYPKNKRLYLE